MTDTSHDPQSKADPRGISDEEHHAHALRARAERRAQAEAIGVTPAFVASLVDSFYARIRADAVLGPIFESIVSDWDEHLTQMKRFWRSILFSTGEYSGNPMRKHVVIPGLGRDHFARWLNLFYATLRAMRIISDIFGYTSREMPKFNSISRGAGNCHDFPSGFCRQSRRDQRA